MRVLADLRDELQSLVWCRQVHGSRVLTVGAEHRAGVSCVGSGDGLVTTTPRLGVMVWSADCVPVLLAGGGAVAAVHAGWRGAVAGVVVAALDRLRDLIGARPAMLTMHLGPAIARCHYPVGPEVIAALEAHGVDQDLWRENDRVDLRAFLAAQARCLGVGRVVVDSDCTACDVAFASFRRDGQDAGRQLSLAYLRGS
jgi:YfiH family protein